MGVGWRPFALIRNGATFLIDSKPTRDEPEALSSNVSLWHGLRDGTVDAIFIDAAADVPCDQFPGTGEAMIFSIT